MSKRFCFRQKYFINGFGCWIWMGATNAKGYGQIYDWKNKTSIKAHRFYYEVKFGEIAKDMTIDHLRSNSTCVNLDHMEVVTRNENVKRYWRQKIANGR